MKKHFKLQIKKSLSLLLVLMMLISVLPMGTFAEQADLEPTYLLFTSDVHNVPPGNTYANQSAERMGRWITGVSAALGGVTFDSMGFCGDMGSAINGSNGYWTAVKNVMNIAEGNAAVNRCVYTYGNHDAESPGNGKNPTADYTACTSKMVQCGGQHYDGYSIFCCGAKAGYYQNFDNADLAKLDTFLAGCAEDEPVFVLSHFPLHYDGKRTISNTTAVINVLNKYPNAVFLWGHNHTDVDSHYTYVYTGSIDGVDINFTYASAGAMVDLEYNEPQSAQIAGKGLTVRINDDQTMTFAYYDVNCKSLGETTVDFSGENAHVNTTGYTAAADFIDGGRYVITATELSLALTDIVNPGFMIHYPDGYFTYAGMNYQEISVNGTVLASEVTEDMVWTAEAVEGGFALKNKDGLYLNAAYRSSSDAAATEEDPRGGEITLGTTPEAWHLDGGKLLASNGKGLTYQGTKDKSISGEITGTAELFTVRTGGNSIAIFKEGKASAANYYSASGFENGGIYILNCNGMAITSDYSEGCLVEYTDGFFRYSGLKGGTLNTGSGMVTSAVSPNMLWTAVSVDGGFALKASNGKYLCATYSSNAAATIDDPKGGNLYLGDTAEAWTLSDGCLKHTASGKYLIYQSPIDQIVSGSANIFTVRSNKEETVELFKSEAIEQTTYEKADTLAPGSKYVLAIGDAAMSGKTTDGCLIHYSDGFFRYSGLFGAEISTNGTNILSDVSSDMIWAVEETEGGIALKNSKTGKYLDASYSTSGGETAENPKGGALFFSDTPAAWTQDGAKLKHKASAKLILIQGKVKEYVSGDYDIFSVRSGGGTFTFYKVVEPAQPPFSRASGLTDGKIYVIMNNDMALTNSPSAPYVNRNGSTHYIYTGFDGAALKVAGRNIRETVDPELYWIAKASGSGFTLSNIYGDYLCAAYNNSSAGTAADPKGGDLYLGSEAQVWTYDGGLKNVKTGKYLSYDNKSSETLVSGDASLFTMRSSQKAVTLFEGSDDVKLPEARETGFNSISYLRDGEQYVLTASGQAMTRVYNEGYSNKLAEDNIYNYYGLNGVSFTASNGAISSAVNADMVWTAEKMSGGFALRSVYGEYLNAEYTPSGPNKGGNLYLGSEPQAWQLIGGKLYHPASGKYATFDTPSDYSGELIRGGLNVFTLRSSGDTFTVYEAADSSAVSIPKYFALKASTLEFGKSYTIKAGDKAMTDELTDGCLIKYPDGYFRYAGLKYTPVTTADGRVTSEITDNMVWSIEQLGSSSFGIKGSSGKYLDAKYANVGGEIGKTPENTAGGTIFHSDTAAKWRLDGSKLKNDSSGKYLLVQGKINEYVSGYYDVFSVRSSGNASSLSFYEVYETAVVTYTTDGHGKVTVTKDPFTADKPEFTGTVASPAPGYVFSHWENEKGETVGTEASFTPTDKVTATYTAVFDEAPEVNVSYVAGANGTVSSESELVKPISGTPAGSTAKANHAYHFLNWTDANGKVISTDPTFVPAKNSDGIYVEATYTANFEKDPVCIGDRLVAVKSGTVKLAFNGEISGEYVLDYVGNAWSIFDPEKDMYVAFENNSLKYTKELFLWQYDGGFYSSTSFTINNAFIAKLLNFNKYYLTCNNGRLDVTRNAVDVNVIEHFVIQDHSFKQFIDNGDGTHTAVCSVCGAKEVTEHVFDDHYCFCGACDIPGTGVTNVNVTVEKTTKTIRFLYFFRIPRTTYEANITYTTGGGITVESVQYRTESALLWRSGTQFTNNRGIGAFDIRIKDSDGNTTYWYYNGTTTERIG